MSAMSAMSALSAQPPNKSIFSPSRGRGLFVSATARASGGSITGRGVASVPLGSERAQPIRTVPWSRASTRMRLSAELPLDHLVLETDSPYLAPRTHRGRRNEPALVLEAARFVAELRDSELAEVARSTTANAARLFRWTGATSEAA